MSGSKQMRLDCPGIQTGELRDLRDRKLFEMFEDEDRLLARRKRLHCRAETLADLPRHRAALRRGLRVGGDLSGSGLLLLLGRSLVKVENQSAALQTVLAPVDANPREPSLEGGAFSKIAEILVGAQEALLCGAVGLSRVPKQPVSNAGDLALILVDEILEGLRAPRADLSDEAALVDSSVCFPWNHRQSRHID